MQTIFSFYLWESGSMLSRLDPVYPTLNWTDLTHESSRPVVTDLIAAPIVRLALVDVQAGGEVRAESVAGVAGTQLRPLLQVAELGTAALLLAPLPLPRH